MKSIKTLSSIFIIGTFLFFALASGGEEKCGCSIPSVTIPKYADSWEDKEENWVFQDCGIANSEVDAEKIHVYVYFNEKLDKYRCELRYSYPGTECSSIGKSFGMNSISTADISVSDYKLGAWKKYEYWLGRQL